MGKIHWIGTGLSSVPGLRRLLNQTEDICVWNRSLDKAQSLVGDLTKNIRVFNLENLQKGLLEINGKPDCRIQKFDEYRSSYRDMYYCDNTMQFATAIEDLEYTKWLDPAGVPCYRKND